MNDGPESVVAKLTPEQTALIERFQTAFNAITVEFRRRLKHEKHVGFPQLVKEFADQFPSWEEYEQQLLAFGRLRNFLVHDETKPFERLAVPVQEAVELIEAMQDWFAKRVIPAFECDVVTVGTIDTLASVLRLVAVHDFSQFPVLDATGRYQGLLTENGITRWLARQVTQNLVSVEFDKANVADVLGAEEPRTTAIFISDAAPLDAVVATFTQEEHLEAILITHSGTTDDKLLGIVTRWDLPRAVYSC